MFPLFATPHFCTINGVTCEGFFQQQKSDIPALGNVNIGAEVE